MDKVIFVGLGGAIGAILRFLISMIPVKTEFPAATLITNLLGAVAIGFIVGLALNINVSKNIMLFLKTGVCGGFTTFSTFSLEAVNLFEKDKPILAIMYIILSVGLCICGVFSGKILSILTFGK